MKHTRKCQGCGREISAYTPRCIYCGKARPIRCVRCKEFTYDGSTTCAHCGAPLPDPARASAPVTAKQPAFEWGGAGETASDGALGNGTNASEAMAPWKTIAIVVSSLLVILVVFQTVLVSSRSTRKSRITKEVHKLWDLANELAEKGDKEGASKTYADALTLMQYHSIDDPEVRSILERELALLTPAPEPAQDAAETDANDTTTDRGVTIDGLKAQGYVVHGPLAFLVKSVSRGFYLQRLCIEVWVKVQNVGTEPVQLSRASFKVVLNDGTSLAADNVYEAYHLPQKILEAEETTSGALLFGTKEKEERLDPSRLKEVKYADQTIWRRKADAEKP